MRGVPLEPLSFASYKERAEAATQKFDALGSGSTDAAAMALLMKGKRQLEQSDFAGALKTYQDVIDSSPEVEMLLTARENLGYTLEAQAMASEDAAAKQAGLEKAAEAFAAMQNDPEGARRDRALYHQARIKATLGQSDDAVLTFKKVLADHPDSMLKADVENRLMALGADS